MAAEHTNPFRKLTEIEIGRFEIETLILAGNGFETGAAEQGLIMTLLPHSVSLFCRSFVSEGLRRAVSMQISGYT